MTFLETAADALDAAVADRDRPTRMGEVAATVEELDRIAVAMVRLTRRVSSDLGHLATTPGGADLKARAVDDIARALDHAAYLISEAASAIHPAAHAVAGLHADQLQGAAR